MGCVVCEHCQAPMNRHEDRAVVDGFSYHEKCHKCYVCSETNLQNAEVFKGVIFCSSCSERIFRGCSTARKAKDSVRRSRERCHKRRSHRTRERNCRPQNGILAMTGLTVSTDTSKSCCNTSNGSRQSKRGKPLAISTDMALIVGKPIYDGMKNVKRSSVEMGMTTEVTHQLLKQMNCPVVNDRKNFTKLAKPLPKLQPVRKKSPCSDLRIAELGTSREIANMVLKHKSELPVIIKSASPTKATTPTTSPSLSLNRESESGDCNDEWVDSAYSTLKNSTKSHWMDRRLGSILKLPYFAFKRNIIDRNSAISELMRTENRVTTLEKIRVAFKQDITDHHRRGLRRLYSTIIRKQTPHRLGWLKLVANVNGDSKNMLRSSSGHKRCKHFKDHSYRCMRAQVMRLAGPTKSELEMLRNKIKNLVAPGFLRNIAIDDHAPVAITLSQACGRSKAESSNK